MNNHHSVATRTHETELQSAAAPHLFQPDRSDQEIGDHTFNLTAGGVEPDRAICFGPFRLLSSQRLLLNGDKAVRIGSRALDILIALTTRQGQLVTNSELRELVWPNTFVVDANLTVNVAALRRALGDGHGENRYILNVPGRGYYFVAPVTFEDRQKDGIATQTAPARHFVTSPDAANTFSNRDLEARGLADVSFQIIDVVYSGDGIKTIIVLAVPGQSGTDSSQASRTDRRHRPALMR